MNYLILGRAKTGTTVISKTIQNSIEGEVSYSLEPKNLEYFYTKKKLLSASHNVVKIIYEHWDKTPRLRNGLIHNEASFKFAKKVAIIRDPRDELLSRLLYIIKPWIDSNGVNTKMNNEWLDLLNQKEKSPGDISFLDLVERFSAIYGADMSSQILLSRPFKNYFEYLKAISSEIHILRYEDFIAGKLENLEDYLELKLIGSRDVGQLNRTMRSAAFNNWKEFFTEKDIEVLKPIYGDVIGEVGYLDWALDGKDSLNPNHYSNYVRRLIAD